MAHSFFAIMGEFVLDHQYSAEWTPSLTAKAIIHIAETDGALLDVPRKLIAHRSKADGITKTLFCV